MDFEITYKLIYDSRTVSGKVINVRNSLDLTHAKKRFFKYISRKNKNAKCIIQESRSLNDDTVQFLKGMFNMN